MMPFDPLAWTLHHNLTADRAPKRCWISCSGRCRRRAALPARTRKTRPRRQPDGLRKELQRLANCQFNWHDLILPP